MAAVDGSTGLAIITPVLAVDLKDPVVPAWTIVVIRFGVVIALVLHQADPCREKRGTSRDAQGK